MKREVLNNLGVTHILCIAETREAQVGTEHTRNSHRPTADPSLDLYSHILKPKFPGEFEYLIQDIRDADDQNLIRIFPQCVPPHTHVGRFCDFLTAYCIIQSMPIYRRRSSERWACPRSLRRRDQPLARHRVRNPSVTRALEDTTGG